ncbi:MAG: hypothetical protein VX641_05860 [Planctomycetota bacterium]|nr:hypothetical protein [Planctomycetota bacterium]
MNRSPRILIPILALLAMVRPGAADTGQVRDVVTANGLHIVVFTAPTPVRAGEVEVVTLVTEESTGRPVDSYALDVEVRSPLWNPTVPSMLSMGSPDPGTRFAYKSVVLLPDPGTWELVVEIRVPDRGGPVRIPLSVVAGAPHPMWWQMLPVLLGAIPFLGLILARDSLLKRARKGDSAL